MKTPIAAATVALAASTLLPTAHAQGLFGRKTADPAVSRASQAGAANAAAAAPAQDPKAAAPRPGSDLPAMNTVKEGAEIPAPAVEGETQAALPQVPLPTGPLEPFLLTKEHGPFMVLAYTFRGPQAPRQAQALAIELRTKYRLPAYILLPKKFPSGSIVRGVPPQAPTFATRDDVGVPEIYRTLDEAAVLVGNEKTIKDSNVLMRQVKKIHPECIDGVQQMWQWRHGQGLSRATMTTNPFIPAEALFPAQRDVLVSQINEGPHNIRNCPGRYSLEIANFAGRKTLDVEHDARFKGNKSIEKSPLFTAEVDAERLADALAKDKEIRQTGFEPYVYHDRFSSRVLIGSFDRPDDPRAKVLHDKILQMTVDLNSRKITDNTVIVPAPNLTDLAKIKPLLQAPPPAQAARAN